MLPKNSQYVLLYSHATIRDSIFQRLYTHLYIGQVFLGSCKDSGLLRSPLNSLRVLQPRQKQCNSIQDLGIRLLHGDWELRQFCKCNGKVKVKKKDQIVSKDKPLLWWGRYTGCSRWIRNIFKTNVFFLGFFVLGI